MKTLFLATALLALVAAPALADSARYTVTFDGTWSPATHPLEYPQGAHFSGLVGATHNGQYAIFREGGTATPGLEALSERGAHSPLDDEIRQAIAAGKAGALFEGAAIFSPPGRAMAEFIIDERFPHVSLAAMIAPSPDWFAGAADVELRENGAWVDQKTVTLYAWDAGTDNGLTYKAPDADAMPRGMISPNGSAHFEADGKPIPVATITFTRMP